ncbi:hypothetical protein [Candidatus Nitrosocosmicus sp. T]
MSLSKNRRNLMVLSLIMISIICSVLTFPELNILQLGHLVSAQIANSNPIQIISTSAYTDDFGNFHIIGEVNNTSTQPQNNIVITAILSDTNNNTVVGNHSSFSSIDTLRTGELSPFDIVIQDPQQILGKFNFMEFITTSHPATEEKPANLVLNGSSSFLDNAGNPHITGSIINQGQSPEQFINLVSTFYDNSSLGVIGTQTFGLNVGNLAHNQIAPFDITITDNKTKSQGAFYSLNVESNQSSMSVPFNTKTSFASTGGFATGGGDATTNTFSVNNQSPFSINNNNDDNDDSRSDDDDDKDDDENDGDNQRGERKTDDEGNPWFDDENCSEESGSSGGSSSECEEAEREEESEAEDEDSLEKDQGPASNSDSDSSGISTDDSNDDIEESNEDEETENN